MSQGATGADGPLPPDEVAAGNTAQAQAWNGADGQYWVRQRENLEARYRRLTPQLMAAAGVRPDSRVLDVGCGSGGTSLAAGRAAAEGSVLGVDLSRPLLAEARQQAAAAGLSQVTFAEGDAQIHRFADGAFDVVLSRFGVMFFADPQAAFRNLARALRPGGRLAFLCWRELRENAYLTVPFAALAPYVQLPDLGAPGAPGPFSLDAADRITALLGGAGFEEISLTALDEPMWVGTDADGALAALTAMPMAQEMLSEVGEETGARARAALRDALAAHQGPDGVTLGCAAWLVTALRR
ncbi:class I SAM-dependent methyltransferase [Streptomyces sp. 2314.4]|uniref:class I SAM-dependent methyltransferase n=1 Tax=Streptomyces sp. 2314.4 TaxID=1881025 RepID=UPI000898A6D6|nr:methyltransferase domain-containing protein [Streptomyces sp. 2314.4]SEE73141.1 Methyltransferase domain-containing protein [Streptomyces sp. 2314.4]